MCGGVKPTDENSVKKGRGEVMAACCLCRTVSWCLRGSGGKTTYCARAVFGR